MRDRYPIEAKAHSVGVRGNDVGVTEQEVQRVAGKVFRLRTKNDAQCRVSSIAGPGVKRKLSSQWLTRLSRGSADIQVIGLANSPSSESSNTGANVRRSAAEMQRQNRRPRLYVQVNTGLEPQKAGIAPEESAQFVEFCRSELGLAIEGLMCIPPAEENPGPHFALLAKLASRCGLSKLSMGMSGDFETAIAFGATSVRVGSAIFGAR